MNSWSEELHSTIDTKLKAANDKDLRFFRIDEFKRNISRVGSFANTCSTCKKEQQNIEEAVETIDEAINKVGKKRKDYDKLISRLSKHIQKEHGFYAPYYYTYHISLIGMIAGSLLGYFLMQLNAELKLELFCLGFALGLLPTYVWGHLKDKKVRHEKRLM